MEKTNNSNDRLPLTALVLITMGSLLSAVSSYFSVLIFAGVGLIVWQMYKRYVDL